MRTGTPPRSNWLRHWWKADWTWLNTTAAAAAMSATTLGELAPLTADLPPAPGSARAPVDLAAVGRAHAPARRWRDFLEPWRGFASLAVILGGIWLVTSIMAGNCCISGQGGHWGSCSSSRPTP